MMSHEDPREVERCVGLQPEAALLAAVLRPLA